VQIVIGFPHRDFLNIVVKPASFYLQWFQRYDKLMLKMCNCFGPSIFWTCYETSLRVPRRYKVTVSGSPRRGRPPGWTMACKVTYTPIEVRYMSITLEASGIWTMRPLAHKQCVLELYTLIGMLEVKPSGHCGQVATGNGQNVLEAEKLTMSTS